MFWLGRVASILFLRDGIGSLVGGLTAFQSRLGFLADFLVLILNLAVLERRVKTSLTEKEHAFIVNG